MQEKSQLLERGGKDRHSQCSETNLQSARMVYSVKCLLCISGHCREHTRSERTTSYPRKNPRKQDCTIVHWVVCSMPSHSKTGPITSRVGFMNKLGRKRQGPTSDMGTGHRRNTKLKARQGSERHGVKRWLCSGKRPLFSSRSLQRSIINYSYGLNLDVPPEPHVLIGGALES